MKTLNLVLATGMLALAGMTLLPTASAGPGVCLTGATNCVEVLPPPYCLAAYHPDSDPSSTSVYAGCLYPAGTCAAAYQPSTNHNVGIGCVVTGRPGCPVGVAVVDDQYICL
jgi:hypothetical protein